VRTIAFAAAALLLTACGGSTLVQPLAETTKIAGNAALYNQYDLAWSPQLGKANCWARNRAKVTIPAKLPKC
jgi:hypothetical protein